MNSNQGTTWKLGENTSGKKIPCNCSVKDTMDMKREPKRGETEQNRRLVTKKQRIILSEPRILGLFGVYFVLFGKCLV